MYFVTHETGEVVKTFLFEHSADDYINAQDDNVHYEVHYVSIDW